MKVNLFLIVSALLTFSNFALSAGGWTSGGGEVFANAKNPWWLPQNTDTIPYCIMIDELNFGTSRKMAEEKISAALNFWQNQFNTSSEVFNAENFSVPIEFRKLRFIKTECNDNVPLKIQLGVLDEVQYSYLKDPTHFIGVAVRTNYDKSQLKGKGFIYISPTSGPLKIHYERLVNEAWQLGNGILLEATLIHEFGHLFGFSHTDHLFLMNESFTESILDQHFAERTIQTLNKVLNDPSISIFNIRKDWNTTPHCYTPAQARDLHKFYGTPEADLCISFVASGLDEPSTFKLQIFSGVTANQMKLFTEIPMKYESENNFPLVKIKDLENQKIFSQHFESWQNLAGHYTQTNIRMRGIYINGAQNISLDFVLSNTGEKSILDHTHAIKLSWQSPIVLH